jgi:hypothetical protein
MMAMLSRTAFISALLLVLLSAPAFADCLSDCQQGWDDYYQGEAAYKSYWGFSYYAEYKCPSNSNNTSEPCPSDFDNCISSCGAYGSRPQSCVDACWAKAGDCCLANLQDSVAAEKAKCTADCAGAGNATAPPTPPQQNQTANVTYNVEITSSGSVYITDLSGNPVSKLANYPVSVKTGSDGNVYLVFKTPGGEREVQLRLAPNSDFRLDTGGECSSPSSAAFSAPAGASLELPQNSPFEQNMQCRSSEHGSIRGTINGGGDFIKSRSIASLAGTARLDLPPPPSASSGRIDVNESIGPDGPGFELTVSLPAGNITVNSTGGSVAYSAEPYNGGVLISVSSGSVSITSSRLQGRSTILSAGEQSLVDPLNINVSSPNPYVPTPSPAPSPAVACASTLDCPGTQVCESGKCANPECFSAFVLAALLGAAFVSSKGREE